MRPVRAEINALVAVLEAEGWETPEQVAEECIKALDRARADRTLYVAVIQFGQLPNFYVGLGPYAGKATARNAAMKFPGAAEAYRIAVVPMMNEAGMNQLLKEVG